MDELQKIRLLKQAGLDPKFHDIDDNGDVHEYNAPIRQDTPQVVQDTQLPSTGMGSAWRAAKRSLVPSAAGLATTGGLLTAMSGPEMASGVGLVPGLASLAGGMGMSYLASKLQDKVAPLSPEEIAQSKADYEQHPYSTLVGEAAPSLLFLRPDNPMPVVKGLSQYARAGTALSKPVQEQLLSMAANAGINTTIDAGMQAMGDEPLDYKRLAAAGLGGALLSKPWLAGKYVGLPDHEFRKPAFADQTKPKVESELVVEKPIVKDPAIQGAVQDFSATQAAKDIVPPESVTFNKNQAPVVEKPVVPVQEPVVDSMVNRIKQADETGIKTPYDKEFQKESKIAPDIKPVEESPFAKMHDEVDKAQTEIANKDTPSKDFKDAYKQKDSALAGTLHTQLHDSEVPSKDWKSVTVEDFLKLAEKRGVKGEVGKVEHEGEQYAGVALLKQRLAKINPEAPGFGADTGAHEIGHVFANDLKEHGSTYEKKLVAEGEKIAGSHEAFVDGVGLQSVEAKKGGAMTEWLKDFWSHIKTKFGNATEEDYRRILSRKLLDDPAFHESNLGAGELKLRISKIDKLEESIAKATDEAEKTKLSAEREKLMNKIGEGLDKDKAEAALYSIRSKIGAGNNEVDESFFRPLESMIASVKRLHPQLGEALEERARVNRHLRGEFSDHYMYLAGEGMKSKGWTKEDFDAVNKFRYDKTHKLPVTELTPTQKEINTEIFEKQSHEVGKKSINSGQLVKDERDPEGYRKMILSKNYHPDMPSKDVAHVLRQEINSPQREEYINKIAQHWFEMGQKFKLDYKISEALTDADNYAKALGGNRTQEAAVKFNALRRAKGMGLPWELTEQDGLSVVKRYGERSARDMAHFLVVEQNPTVRSMLNEPDQFGSKKDNIKDLKDYSGTQEVRDVMNYVGQQKSVREQTIQSVSRAIVGGFIGPVSGMRNVVSSWVQSMPYKEMKDFGVGINSLVKSMQDGWEASFKSGVNRTNILDTEFQPSSVNQITDSFTKIGNTLAKYQGRNLMEQFSRAWRFTEGQLLAEAKLGRAIEGDVESINWLEKFGKGNQPVENLIKRGKLAADELDNIAANYVERVEGTYDERGLPSIAVQGTLSPFLSLSKWSIEKSNTIYQDVVKPLLNRDPGSMEKFLLYSLGSVLGGEAIHALADEMNKKLSYDTDLKEVHASRFSSPEDYAIATVNMLQLAGLAGVVSDFAKIGMNTAQGKPAQGYNYPLAQFVGDNVAGTLRDYAVAIDNGQPVFDTTLNAAVEVLRNTVQSARIAYNWTHPEEIEQKNIRRDLRTYKEFTGQPAGEIGASKNSVLAGKDVRDFKQTTDLKEAQQELPELLRNIVQKSRNPEELKQHLESLRVMPVSEFPSLESSPQAFGEFVQFLTDKYGAQRTAELIQYYQKRQLSQEAKKSLVPTTR